MSVAEESTSKATDLVQGTLDLLILTIVALEPVHGWAIAQRIRQMLCDALQLGQSALYPALQQAGAARLDYVRVEDVGDEPPREVLLAHAAGRKAVPKEAANWERLSAAISEIVRAV